MNGKEVEAISILKGNENSPLIVKVGDVEHIICSKWFRDIPKSKTEIDWHQVQMGTLVDHEKYGRGRFINCSNLNIECLNVANEKGDLVQWYRGGRRSLILSFR